MCKYSYLYMHALTCVIVQLHMYNVWSCGFCCVCLCCVCTNYFCVYLHVCIIMYSCSDYYYECVCVCVHVKC